MADLPPPVQGPTAKEKKYDRQLRLWGATGQQALENSHILLMNSGPGVTGLETLKNLVLPGIGQFTIQDSAVVSEADLGVSFFLEEEHVGGFRAEHSCNLLKELNPDVEGHYITEPIETFATQPDAFKPYTLILVTAPVRPEILAKLSAHADASLVPLFYIHSVGFYSHFSIHLPPAYPIVDTHPSPETTTDLRLLKPWPELLQFAEEKTSNLDAMAHDDHGHIPYIAILLYYLEQWKKEHGGNPPQNYKEKTAFRDIVTKAARTNNPEGGEENFDEAVGAVLKSLNPPEPSSSVKDLFKEKECVVIKQDSPSFWVIAHAIGLFYTKYGVLPVPGSVPDMKARSADYVQLQNVYKSKARKDFAEVLESVRFVERTANRSTQIEEKDVEAFCKNAAHIKLVRGRPFHVVQPNESIKWADRAKAIVQNLTFPDSLVPLYIAFLAWDKFAATHDQDGLVGAQQVPGETDAETDAGKVTGIALKITDDLIKEAVATLEEDELETIKSQVREFVEELVRAGGGELHNIAALTGGLVSQEVIKVITEQYVPVDNTCIFDGVKSKTAVIRV
ncbi:NEDD8-activating enzyme E1 regulatory subunit [Aaosphaeria arxii CBS 175.79]|uniref:NEDD8-activating enzyme E1 regulatory subunit n=1 Tax=Aaosphaeria arxii CBS 175.79 TaxID=1450172 RepID=A0A6A5XAA8_9PLEO|nr:NEDD8-activating enzyme E1 regulatory subunit [Aaosphaeria arxii CBS 175.79]KAF2009918.1 NEDD8-activating enzyme E1 regulatory subunit [Aaosphaeria arxii CBS 175.79]